MASPLHSYLSRPEWYILDIGWDPSKQRNTETLLTLGNGYLGSRGVLEESPVDGQPGTFFAGLFDDTGAQVTEMINAPQLIPRAWQSAKRKTLRTVGSLVAESCVMGAHHKAKAPAPQSRAGRSHQISRYREPGAIFDLA